MVVNSSIENRGKLNLIDWAIWFLGIIFIVFLVSVSISVRPCSDDLYLYAEYIDKGWFFSIWEMDTNIRLTGFLVFNALSALVKNFQDFSRIFFFYYLSLFSLLLFSTYRLIKTIFIYVIQVESFRSIQVFNMSLLFMSLFYFSTVNAQEVWFWTIATTIYLLPIPLIFLAISELIRFKTKRAYFTAGVLFFLIGGMVENLVLTVFSLLFLLNIFNWFQFRRIDLRLVLSKSTIMILPFFSVIHSGLGNRIKNETYYLINNGIFKTLYSDYDFGPNYNRMIIILLLLVLVFYMGQTVRFSTTAPSLNYKKMLVLSFLVLIISFLSTFSPMFILNGNLGSARASLPFSLILIIQLFCWVFILGGKFRIKNIIYYPTSVFAILLMGIFTYTQINYTSQFAHEYDNRVKDIIRQKESKATFLVVKPLPDSGVIPSQELNNFREEPSTTSYYIGRVNGVNKDVFLDTTSLKKSEK